MKTRYKLLIGFVVLLIIIRLILPYVALRFANDRLANLPGYYGHVTDIDINLFRGAYILRNFYVNKIDSTSKKQTAFFKSNAIDLSLEWKPLFRGAIVGKLALISPSLIFTKDKVELEKVKKDTTDFRKMVKSFMPLRINRFEIQNGELHYVDSTSVPIVDVFLKKTHILAINLTNVTTKKILLPSTVTAQTDVYEGIFTFNMKLNALAERPTFELDAELNNTNLVLLNDFFKAYGKFAVSKGTFGLYTELAAKDGNFVGYVKPVIKNLKVKELKAKDTNILHKFWVALVGAVAFVFKNKSENQIATKLPLEGSFANPEPDVFYAIWKVLQNAFVQALTSSIDNEISMSSVKDDKGKKERKSDSAGSKRKKNK